MEVTEVKIRRLTDEPKMRAIVSVTFDGELAVHDIKVIQGQDKLFLAMPSRKLANGAYADIAHPTTPQLRVKIENAVIKKYTEAVSKTVEFSEETDYDSNTNDS